MSTSEDHPSVEFKKVINELELEALKAADETILQGMKDHGSVDHALFLLGLIKAATHRLGDYVERLGEDPRAEFLDELSNFTFNTLGHVYSKAKGSQE